MFNLREQITAEDRVKLENYINLYGVGSHFIGVDNWLVNWANNKVKLYKLLNNQLIYKVPYTYEKPQAELREELDNLFYEDNGFCEQYRDYIYDLEDNGTITHALYNDLVKLCYSTTLMADKTEERIKFKLPNAKKEFQLQPGMKACKSLSKVVTYLKDSGYKDLSKEFEEFRVKHSIIFNDKLIHSNLVFSIHPLDFITMSDNSSNWQSCMNWHEEGCYRVGTIEMMNSNNVICCYLEAKEPYNFAEQCHNKPKGVDYSTDDYVWTNKKWRQLVYVTKDIIVSGKSYPFTNDDVTKFIIEKLRELAKANLNWTYSFGVERYYDMKYINGSYSMERAKGWIRYGNATKHNILFESNGMYNDMVNDSNFHYWCVRNKVDHTKVITYSGKPTCLCCGDSIINFCEGEDYNNRWDGTGNVVCRDCDEKYFSCCSCGSYHHFADYIQFTDATTGKPLQMCDICWNETVRKCPCCGKPMYYGYKYNRPKVFTPIREDNLYDKKDFDTIVQHYNWRYKENPIKLETLMPVFVCKDCGNKLIPLENRALSYTAHDDWGYTTRYTYDIMPHIPVQAAEAMHWLALERVEPKQDQALVLEYSQSYFGN